MMTKNILTYFAFAASMLASSTTNAVLAPDATNDLKNSADAEMLLAVSNVLPRSPSADDEASGDYDPHSSCMNYYAVEANIIAIPKTNYMGGLQVGDSLTFDSWYYDYSDAACAGFVGPSSPPLIKPNYCGYVWLNLPDSGSGNNGDDYTLAAYGDSFDKQPAAACN